MKLFRDNVIIYAIISIKLILEHFNLYTMSALARHIFCRSKGDNTFFFVTDNILNL